MRKWTKYLLPLIVAVAFWNYEDSVLSVVPEEVPVSQLVSEAVCGTIVSSSESEICLPRQVSYASPSRVQNTARRTTGYSRINVEFAKSGKVINAGLTYFIQNKSITIHSSLTEPSHKLLCLGILII